jgi:hypothetical protein
MTTPNTSAPDEPRPTRRRERTREDLEAENQRLARSLRTTREKLLDAYGRISRLEAQAHRRRHRTGDRHV